jgi:hypothetical protein
MKIATFWDVVPCSLLGVDQQFRGAYCLHHQGIHRPDDGGSMHSEMSVYSKEATWRYIPEDSNLHTCHRKNLNLTNLNIFVVEGLKCDMFSFSVLTLNKIT